MDEAVLKNVIICFPQVRRLSGQTWACHRLLL